MNQGADARSEPATESPLRVLLVEDDNADARLTTAFITSGRSNVEVTHSLTLAQAFEERGKPFDVILSDLNLPDSSGTATVSRLSVEFPGIPLIALTIDDERGLACIAAGAQDFIAKIELNRKTLGRAVEFSLQRAQQTRSTEIASRHDPLTGLLNRAAFEEAASAAILAMDPARPYSIVLFIDVNKFKEINDEYGHAAGDQVLKGVARKLRSAVRAEDIVCRWGGDEFVVFGRAESSSAASNMALRVRQKMEFVQPIDRNDVTVHINARASVGAAIEDEPTEGLLPALIEIADSAMYAEKPDYTASQVPDQRDSRQHIGHR